MNRLCPHCANTGLPQGASIRIAVCPKCGRANKLHPDWNTGRRQ